jgi:hypothetical protein
MVSEITFHVCVFVNYDCVDGVFVQAHLWLT